MKMPRIFTLPAAISAGAFWAASKYPQANGDWHEALTIWGIAFAAMTVASFVFELIFPEGN